MAEIEDQIVVVNVEVVVKQKNIIICSSSSSRMSNRSRSGWSNSSSGNLSIGTRTHY